VVQVLSLPFAVSVAWVMGAVSAVLPLSVVVLEGVAAAVRSSGGVAVRTTSVRRLPPS
jgi:hypothetical protein